MRLLHTKGFSASERKQWKVTIFNNLLHAFQVIFGAMEEQEVDFAHETNIVSSPMLSSALNSHTDILEAFRGDHCCRP
jgi:guanine nucleotide-binding protein subunit alpha